MWTYGLDGGRVEGRCENEVLMGVLRMVRPGAVEHFWMDGGCICMARSNLLRLGIGILAPGQVVQPNLPVLYDSSLYMVSDLWRFERAQLLR